ncbi:MAG: DMT family transporter [Actinobacteria bacterium]|nr:DMT family transporter [Actinomycetota bacterium]
MFAVGVIGAMQPPINAALAKRTGSFEAATVSFAIGTLALLAVALIAGGGGFAAVRSAPLWQLTGGFVGALFVWSTIVLVPRVGTTALLAGIIAGQLTGGVLIDRFGLFGMAQIGVTWYRALGIFLLVVGGMLVLRR